ncbi:HAD family hydrolase [Enterococcus sp. PF-2]|nr:HAD hydrolase, family IA, variant 1 [Enterococcus faecalis 06-MB-DW-09]MBO1098141.1 HAD family hydrolase [Enterococcus casseliflavus]MBO1145419.1 HAD family hydrolase [Enterococcus casseliflavus]TPE01547.1 HAD family hydrolase [Enterococcus sp. PF-3]TPE25003.1 HAD family hydrolase [Enterococcus sp. PF-2]
MEKRAVVSFRGGNVVKKIECVIFDLDGTLLDSRECSIKATKAAFTEMGLKVPSEVVIEHYMGIPIEESFFKMSEQPLDQETATELIRVFRTYYQTYEESTLNVFPEIPHVLEILMKRKVPCFVVSSKKTAVVKRNLAAQNLVAFFEEIIGSDAVSHYKPHPEGINKVVTQYQFDPTRTIMVGDAIFDIQMGKAAGVKTIAVTWGSHDAKKLSAEKPDALAEAPQDILDYIYA